MSFFKDVKQRLVERLGSEEAGVMLSRESLILVCLGNNDYLTNYFGNPFGLSSSQRKYSPHEFSNLLVSIYKENLLVIQLSQFNMQNVCLLGFKLQSQVAHAISVCLLEISRIVHISEYEFNI